MLVCCWSVKGGSGTSVAAASLASVLANQNPNGALLVDLDGDGPAILGEPAGPPWPGVADWLRSGCGGPADGLRRLERPVGPGFALLGRGTGAFESPDRWDLLATLLDGDERPVVVDCGQVLDADGGLRPLVGELAARGVHSLLVVRPCYLALRRLSVLPLRPSGVVLVAEVGRALGRADVESVVGAPVVAELPLDPAVARCVDAGLLGHRLPRSMTKGLRPLVASL